MAICIRQMNERERAGRFLEELEVRREVIISAQELDAGLPGCHAAISQALTAVPVISESASAIVARL